MVNKEGDLKIPKLAPMKKDTFKDQRHASRLTQLLMKASHLASAIGNVFSENKINVDAHHHSSHFKHLLLAVLRSRNLPGIPDLPVALLVFQPAGLGLLHDIP